MTQDQDQHTIVDRVLVLYIEMLKRPTPEGIKRIGSFQRKFTDADWTEFSNRKESYSHEQ